MSMIEAAKDPADDSISLDNVLQNLEMMQKQLLAGPAEKIFVLERALYSNELERLGKFNGKAQGRRLEYTEWFQEYAAGNRPSPIPWKKNY